MCQTIIRKLTQQELDVMQSKIKGVACPHCRVAMGIDHNLYTMLSAAPNLAPTTVAVPIIRFVCPSCGRMELFDFNVFTKRQ